MFLTTNQIKNFDIAIPSRVHVAIQYKSLTPIQTQAIFKGFLDKLDDDMIDDKEDLVESWVDEKIIKSGFDGRQIRNTITVALGLARASRSSESGGTKLKKEHLQRAYDNVASFKNNFEVQMERYKESQSNMIQ